MDVEGSGFLYNMVRNMVGTLIEIGRGRWEPERVLEILASGDRANAGPTAPANGLCMQWVKYVPGMWRPHRRERGDSTTGLSAEDSTAGLSAED